MNRNAVETRGLSVFRWLSLAFFVFITAFPLVYMISLSFKDRLIVPWATCLKDYFSLCPSNADARAYSRTLVADLTRTLPIDPARVAAHDDTALFIRCPDVDGMYHHLRSKDVDVEPPKVAPSITCVPPAKSSVAPLASWTSLIAAARRCAESRGDPAGVAIVDARRCGDSRAICLNAGTTRM